MIQPIQGDFDMTCNIRMDYSRLFIGSFVEEKIICHFGFTAEFPRSELSFTLMFRVKIHNFFGKTICRTSSVNFFLSIYVYYTLNFRVHLSFEKCLIKCNIFVLLNIIVFTFILKWFY